VRYAKRHYPTVISGKIYPFGGKILPEIRFIHRL
jgi:hypothetical protein